MGLILFDIFINDFDDGTESEFIKFLNIIQFRGLQVCCKAVEMTDKLKK